LAGDSSISCGTCHIPDQGFQKAEQLSPGYPATKHWRSVPTVLNAAYHENFFWDGRAGSLEEQAQGPIQAPIEMNQNPGHLEQKLQQIPYYRDMFKKVFNSDVDFGNLAKAIAAFERTIVSKNAPIDAFLKGDEGALEEDQKRGLALFKGKAGCVQCHSGPLLMDGGFHATGVPETEELQKESDRIATRHFFARDAGYKDWKNVTRDQGREFITKSKADRNKFKTMSLREVLETAPYMHNGAFVTIEEVVDFYNKGGGTVENKDPLLKPLNLTDQEKGDLIAFLESLSGDPIEIEAPELPKKGDGSF
jgi:cytochrome c peroxidase